MSRRRVAAALSFAAAAAVVTVSDTGAAAATALAADRIVVERTPTGLGIGYPSIWSMKNDGTDLAVVRDIGEAAKRPRLGPDRTKVLYYTGDANHPAEQQLEVMNADGSGLSTVIVPAGGPPGLDWEAHAHAEWSPDGRYIVMSAGSLATPQIWLADVANLSSPIFVLISTQQNGLAHLTPSFNPDQGSIVYSRCPSVVACVGTDREIYLMSSLGDAYADIRLTTDSGTQFDDREPYYSNDGATISFSRFIGCRSQIYKIPSSGGQPIPIVNDESFNLTATWDGATTPSTTLYYDRYPGQAQWKLYRVRRDGSEFTPIGAGTTCSMEYPNVTQNSASASSSSGFGQLPMSRMLAVVSLTDGPAPDDHDTRAVYSMDLDGTNRTRLTTSSSSWPQLSPDRRRVLFYRNPSGDPNDLTQNELWSMNFDGSGQTRLIPKAGPTSGMSAGMSWLAQGHATWSPDGNYIAMIAQATGSGAAPTLQIWVTNSDGSNPVQITTQANQIHHLDPSWNPDQGSIVYSRCPSTCEIGDPAQELYLVSAFGDTYADIRLTNDGWSDYDPYYSPDGAEIAWLRQVSCKRWGIFSASTTTSWPTTSAAPVFDDGGINSKPEWSRDSLWIYFHRLPADSIPDIWTVQGDGTGRSPLNTGPGASHCGLRHPTQSAP